MLNLQVMDLSLSHSLTRADKKNGALLQVWILSDWNKPAVLLCACVWHRRMTQCLTFLIGRQRSKV